MNPGIVSIVVVLLFEYVQRLQARWLCLTEEYPERFVFNFFAGNEDDLPG
jgi:hypothetical protein